MYNYYRATNKAHPSPWTGFEWTDIGFLFVLDMGLVRCHPWEWCRHYPATEKKEQASRQEKKEHSCTACFFPHCWPVIYFYFSLCVFFSPTVVIWQGFKGGACGGVVECGGVWWGAELSFLEMETRRRSRITKWWEVAVQRRVTMVIYSTDGGFSFSFNTLWNSRGIQDPFVRMGFDLRDGFTMWFLFLYKNKSMSIDNNQRRLYYVYTLSIIPHLVFRSYYSLLIR